MARDPLGVIVSQPARSCPAENIEFIPCRRPFSNFDLVEEQFSGIQPMRRVLSQARMHHARTIVVERGLLTASDLLEEDEDLLQLMPGFKPTETVSCRVSFFRERVTKRSLARTPNNSFVGYAVLKKDSTGARVYESVMAPSRHANNYVRGAPSWTCAIAGRQFSITGYLYAQQNAVSNSCAHVALRTVATRFLGSDLSYRQINAWVAQYQRNNGEKERPPADGLTNDEICHVLEQCGARTFVADCERPERPPVSYQLRLYASAESGFPGVVFFGTEQHTAEGNRAYHVIPVFGHTFNEDTWAPGADLMYFPLRKATKCLTSAAWVSMFVGHDDNAGSNYCIPQHYMEPHRICRDDTGTAVLDDKGNPLACRQQGGSVSYAIATVPTSVKADPIEAEAIAADYLLAILQEIPETFPGWKQRWQKRLAVLREGAPKVRSPEGMILRTSFITGAQYVDHLAAVRGWDRKKRIPHGIRKVLSPFADDLFWITEVSLPELFSANRRKVGEVLIRADRQPTTARDAGSFLLARLPGCLVFLSPPTSGTAPETNGDPSFVYIPLEVDDHVELLACEESKTAQTRPMTLFSRLAAIVLALMASGHLVARLMGDEPVIRSWKVPMWIIAAGCAIVLALAAVLWREAARRSDHCLF